MNLRKPNLIDRANESLYTAPMKYDSALKSHIQALIAERDEAVLHVERLNAAIAALTGDKFDKAASKNDAAPTADHIDHIDIEAVAPKSSDRFEGMTQPQMAFDVLEKSGAPMLPREILDIWVKHGVEPYGADRVKKVQSALKRRQKSPGDVLHVGSGKWALRAWYSAAEIERFISLEDGAGARDKAEHQKRMVEGIKKAKARGAHYGGAPKILPEQWELAKKLIADGETKWSVIHRAVCDLTPVGEKPMVYQTIVKWREDLKAQKPYPERWQNYWDAHRKDDNTSQKIRVVK